MKRHTKERLACIVACLLPRMVIQAAIDRAVIQSFDSTENAADMPVGELQERWASESTGPPLPRVGEIKPVPVPSLDHLQRAADWYEREHDDSPLRKGDVRMHFVPREPTEAERRAADELVQDSIERSIEDGGLRLRGDGRPFVQVPFQDPYRPDPPVFDSVVPHFGTERLRFDLPFNSDDSPIPSVWDMVRGQQPDDTPPDR
jgi:hypothetical protein